MLINAFEGKNVLVTGGTGSIGSEIVRRLLRYDPKQIRIFSRDESKQADMQHELADDRLRFLIGDVRDKERVKFAMQDVDIVFHAAALKHVNLCEYNPFEAVKTNVVATQIVIEESIKSNVHKFVNISTDKVTAATNTMGATKLLAERLTIAANMYKGPKRTIFSCVRFGNVVDSRGSALNLFKKQINQGGPVTVTDPDMTRFVMSVAQAAQLVLKAAEYMEGGETFILKMPAVKLGDMVDALIETYSADAFGVPHKIPVKIVGIRPGEKIHESLITPDEAKNVVDMGDMYALLPHIYSRDAERNRYFRMPRGIECEYVSNSANLLSIEQIKVFLKEQGIV